MIEASIKNKIKLLCGHTQSFGPHIRTMRKIIRSGELGRLCALHVWAYTDWMLRPRTAEELDINQGGGVPYRQGPHQIDTLRLLGGGMVRSVRGSTGAWFKGRPIPGYYSAFMEFEDGTPATLMHNGYGYFLASELVPWGGQNSRYSEAERAAIRKSLARRHARRKRRQGRTCASAARNEREVRDRSKVKPWLPNDLGILVATCEKGDIRQSQHGLFVHSDEGTKDVPLIGGGGPSRRGELMELYNAVVLDKPIRHTGPWGMATLEVCLAIMRVGEGKKRNLLEAPSAGAGRGLSIGLHSDQFERREQILRIRDSRRTSTMDARCAGHDRTIHDERDYNEGDSMYNGYKYRRRSRPYDHARAFSPVSRRNRLAEHARSQARNDRRAVGSRPAAPSEIHGRPQHRHSVHRPAAHRHVALDAAVPARVLGRHDQRRHCAHRQAASRPLPRHGAAAAIARQRHAQLPAPSSSAA